MIAVAQPLIYSKPIICGVNAGKPYMFIFKEHRECIQLSIFQLLKLDHRM